MSQMLQYCHYLPQVRAMGTKHSFLLAFIHVHVLRLVPVPPSHVELSGKRLSGKRLLTQVVLTGIRDSSHGSSS
jgi:hypothetical protein